MSANVEKKSGPMYPEWSALDLEANFNSETYNVFKNTITKDWVGNNSEILKELQEKFEHFCKNIGREINIVIPFVPLGNWLTVGHLATLHTLNQTLQFFVNQEGNWHGKHTKFNIHIFPIFSNTLSSSSTEKTSIILPDENLNKSFHKNLNNFSTIKPENLMNSLSSLQKQMIGYFDEIEKVKELDYQILHRTVNDKNWIERKDRREEYCRLVEWYTLKAMLSDKQKNSSTNDAQIYDEIRKFYFDGYGVTFPVKQTIEPYLFSEYIFQKSEKIPTLIIIGGDKLENFTEHLSYLEKSRPNELNNLGVTIVPTIYSEGIKWCLTSLGSADAKINIESIKTQIKENSQNSGKEYSSEKIEELAEQVYKMIGGDREIARTDYHRVITSPEFAERISVKMEKEMKILRALWILNTRVDYHALRAELVRISGTNDNGDSKWRTDAVNFSLPMQNLHKWGFIFVDDKEYNPDDQIDYSKKEEFHYELRGLEFISKLEFIF